ncbi:MAG: gamma-glutamyltransferase family protein [Promethearchaeia archaeon]
MNQQFKWNFPYDSQRMPILAENVVTTSQPLAAQAGLRMLLKGGNAVDAAIATAIALTVLEPTSNGLGSDAFCILWDGEELVGLNASGRSPVAWTTEYFQEKYDKMPLLGWDTVTVPGAVSAWVKLWKRFGSLEFRELFEPAINYAREGFIITPIIGTAWRFLARQYKKFPEWVDTFTLNGKVPKPGQLFKLPHHAKSLELIAESNGETFYRGELAEKIVAHAKDTGGKISFRDLKNHNADWVDPIEQEYHGITLHEIPPNGQGLAALIALGILKHLDIAQYRPESTEALHFQMEAMKLAFRDVHRYIADPAAMRVEPKALLAEDYCKKRADLIKKDKATDFKYGKPKIGDTVYLTTADKNGMMVSYIQSNFWSFGSGIVIPETGISLQNRGNGFTLAKGHPNQVGSSKRPYHTIIPAFITESGKPLMSFGVMGGYMQPQGHIQMVLRIFDYHQNPQTAADAPRWRVEEGVHVKMENKFPKETLSRLGKMGHKVLNSHSIDFGGAQLIYKLKNGYCAASEPRKDGQAVGF